MSSRSLLFAITAITVACSGKQQIGTEEPGAGAGSGGSSGAATGVVEAGAGQAAGSTSVAGDTAVGTGGGMGGNCEKAGASAGGASAGAPSAGAPSAGAANVGGTTNIGGTANVGGAASAGGASAGAAGGVGSESLKILILSTTLEFMHDSIKDCQQMLGFGSDKSLALSSEWSVDVASNDLAQFTDATLQNYNLVFSCSPTGRVFSNNPNVKDKKDQTVAMAAFQHFVENGGAWAGVHAAIDFEKTGGFPWFTDTLSGAYLVDHSNDGTQGTVQSDPSNAASAVLAGLSASYLTRDEWINMNRDVTTQPGFQVLQRLAADNHPITWIKEIANPNGGVGGRMFYTARGHNKSVYQEKQFRELVRQGILWATRRTH